jgi:TolB-like protein
MAAPPPALEHALRDHYVLERELGRGGMATVYLARDLKHDRSVAVKILHPALSAALGSDRFLNEIRISARLDHPHILTLIDSGSADGVLWYVLPYVRGESLRERLRRERQLPLADALRITRQIASALDYAHGEGVIHRDIKPENVLLFEGEAMLADFGIALAITTAGGERLTETGLSLGTPAYMSPEQATADPDLDGRSDQYGLACMVYEMLAGEPPYTGPTAQAVIAKRLSEPTPHLRTVREVPRHVENALLRALSRSPADRFATATAFAYALERGSGTPGRVLRPPRRVLAAMAAVTLALIVGGTSLVRLRSTAPALDSRRVVVAVFENRTGEPRLDALGLTVADYLSRTLLRTGLVSVGDIGTLYVRGREASGKPADARTLAREAGAANVIAGSFTAAGDSLEFAAQVLDVASGSLRQSFDPARVPRTDPMAALPGLEQRVAAGLATLVDARFNTFARRPAAPPSWEAYRAFAEGQERFWREGPDSVALALFRQATAADPSFTTAAVWLAFASSAPLLTCPTTDSIVRALAPLRERLDPLDRLNLDWSAAYCRGDAEGLYRIALASARLQPSSGYARYWVALWAYCSNRPHEAISILTRLDRTRDLDWMPDSSKFLLYRDLTRAYHMLGEHERELAVAEEFANREPPRVTALFLRARALAALGRSTDALRLLDSARGLPDDETIWETSRPDDFATVLSVELAFHGDAPASRRAAQRALDFFDQRADTLPTYGIASMALAAGRPEVARRYLAMQRASSQYQSSRTWQHGDSPWLATAVLLALVDGDTARADRLEDSLARGTWSHDWGRHTYERARIAAYRGDRERAMALLRDLPRMTGGMLWPHYWPGLAPMRGYAPFEALLQAVH